MGKKSERDAFRKRAAISLKAILACLDWDETILAEVLPIADLTLGHAAPGKPEVFTVLSAVLIAVGNKRIDPKFAHLVIDRLISEDEDIKGLIVFEKKTVLHCLSWNDDSDLIKKVLPMSDIGAIDDNGFTAAEVARDHGHAHIAELIEAFALSQKETDLFEDILPQGKPSTKKPNPFYK